MSKITTFLTYESQAAQAVELYTSVFERSRVVNVSKQGDQVFSLEFELEGQLYYAMNAGPHFKFSDGISLFVRCETQDEVDRYWQKLSEGGSGGRCGWLEDRFGVSWQIIPSILGTLMRDPDRDKAGRVMAAMLKMNKLDIADLEAAAKG